MTHVSKLLIADFIKQERESLIRIEDELLFTPMTYEQRLTILEGILKRGISFGIEKGIFIEEERSKKINSAKSGFVDKYVDELIFSINYRNATYRDLPRVKYAKRKYRMRKKHGGEQLKLKFAIL